MNAQKDPTEEMPRYNPLNSAHPRSSSLLNIQDPVAMHLLMETAMGDSADYEVLSYEEIEELKKEHALLTSRIEATRKKFALESKLRDAAQSLNRLYTGKDGKGGLEMGPDGIPRSPPKTRKSFLGRKSNEGSAPSKNDDEYLASMKKCEDLAQEIWRLEKRDQQLRQKILEHTAGILQMTHKGLKKNVRREELPRSPESMVSYGHQSIPRFDGADDFDDRSLYRVIDYLDDDSSRTNGLGGSLASVKALEEAEKRISLLGEKLQHTLEQVDAGLVVKDSVPQGSSGGSQLPARIDHLEKSVDALALAHARAGESNQRTIVDSEGQLQEINTRLYDMLTVSNYGQTPAVPPPNPSNRNLRSQLSFVGLALGQLTQRVEHFVEQKAILTTQIQQQRELNSKSDAQRDAQITDLTEQLAQAKKALTMTEQENQTVRDQAELLMEQLDDARQQVTLREQQRFMDESKALQAERGVNRQAMERLETELESKQQQFTEIQAALSAARNDIEIRAQQHEQQLRELSEAKEQAEIDARRSQEELTALEGEVARAQTELTVVRAELDGAYGTRAQRAADVSSNPVIQREMDELNDKNTSLVQQLESVQKEHEKIEANYAELMQEFEDLRTRHEKTQMDFTERNTNLLQDMNTMKSQHEKVKSDLDDKTTSLIHEIEYLRANPPAGQTNATDLQAKVDTLQKELKETIEDYELMTRASIEFERERDQFEVIIDGLRERCENLEGQLSDERVRWMGLKSPATMNKEGTGPSELTSTMVLKNEFKKMMRDTRAENMKALKAEKEERRRLEALVRNLRKEQQLLQSPENKVDSSQSQPMQ
ncbi:putative involucrin repeat protein [Phaeomoniella chlamydospora]|uniref:Putative involucrin repeat protein n=1 Tax=Phaeomoniella chlamydospora TaxID=158046 RepID=A0A0G2HKQ0_PHACM|nr:putative involucrin repeat protein [Phaeomoniella chlamydospora]